MQHMEDLHGAQIYCRLQVFIRSLHGYISGSMSHGNTSMSHGKTSMGYILTSMAHGAASMGFIPTSMAMYMLHGDLHICYMVLLLPDRA